MKQNSDSLADTPDTVERLKKLHEKLRACRLCKTVQGRAVHGPAFRTPVMLVGQAPGVHEETLGRPFAYTAGKTLFKLMGEATGASEEDLREMIYFSAVARCFPGKSTSGKGDRTPSALEISNCSQHLREEINAVRPKIILAVGRVAILEVLATMSIKKTTPLEQLVGRKIRSRFHGHEVDVIPLPHPSGVSSWPHTEPGKSRLKAALELIRSEVAPLF